jgi:hypothetical protein
MPRVYIYIYIYTHTHIYICVCVCVCVCISVKSAFVKTTKSTRSLHNALYNNAQNILHIHTRTFLKMSGFQRGRSNRATRGYGSVSHVFLAGWSAYSSLIFWKFLVGAMRPLETPLAAGRLSPRRHAFVPGLVHVKCGASNGLSKGFCLSINPPMPPPSLFCLLYSYHKDKHAKPRNILSEIEEHSVEK